MLISKWLFTNKLCEKGSGIFASLMCSLLPNNSSLHNLSYYITAGVYCRIVAAKPLLLLHKSVDYIFGGFGIFWTTESDS